MVSKDGRQLQRRCQSDSLDSRNSELLIDNIPLQQSSFLFSPKNDFKSAEQSQCPSVVRSSVVSSSLCGFESEKRNLCEPALLLLSLLLPLYPPFHPSCHSCSSSSRLHLLLFHLPLFPLVFLLIFLAASSIATSLLSSSSPSSSFWHPCSSSSSSLHPPPLLHLRLFPLNLFPLFPIFIFLGPLLF